MPYPQIASYTQAIQQNGPGVFRTIRADNFEPSSLRPIKVFHYGSGMFAVVFKINTNGKPKAVRCFISQADNTVKRYSAIADHLNSRYDLPWKVNFNFYDNEISINGANYPVVLMDWVDGLLINKYINSNLFNTQRLSELQQQLVQLAQSLTINQIGHGDLQAGNIFVARDGQLKLIDYDSMFVPALNGMQSNEVGRPEYQHPARTRLMYNDRVDWFSIWVMVTAIEAIKIDPNLWKRGYEGGFNTQENFLFLGDDFSRPEQSNLFRILLDKNSESLKFYTNRLLQFCRQGINSVSPPALAPSNVPPPPPPRPPFEGATDNGPQSHAGSGVTSPSGPPPEGKFSIRTTPNGVNILSHPMLQRIGNTPFELDKRIYSGKSIVLSYSGKSKVIRLEPGKDVYAIDFI